MKLDYSFPGSLAGVGGLGGIARQQLQTLREHDALGEAYEHLSRYGTAGNDWEHDAAVALHRYARDADKLTGDVMGVHAWGNAALATFTLRLTEERPQVRVLERASTHPAWQARVLHDEARALGLGYDLTNDLDVQRGCLEAAHASRVIVPSDQARDTFPIGLREKVVVVPFGTDTDAFHPPAPVRSEEHEDHMAGRCNPAACRWCVTFGPGKDGHVPTRVTFGYAGYNFVRKGLVRLLHAWRLAEAWEGGATLEVASVPPDVVRDLCVQLRIQPVAHGVHAVGRVKDQAAWLRGLDAFVLPSLEEGHAQVLLEAGATGLPVVTTLAAGHPITHGKEGLIVPAPPGKAPDAAALAEALKAVVADEASRKAMGQAHLALVRNQFRWSNYRERLWQQAYKPTLEA